MSILTQKKCSKCGEIKGLQEFSKNSHQRDGRLNTCKECSRKAFKAWRLKNSEREKQKAREYREMNFTRISEHFAQWRKDNLERTRENFRRWSLANHDKIIERSRNKRALKKQSGGKVTVQEWRALKAKYNFACLRCGRKEPEIKLTLDHVIPLKLGGANTIDNAQPLCSSCNSSKRDKHIDYRKDF